MSLEMSLQRFSKASVLSLALALSVPASAQTRDPLSSSQANFAGALLGEVRNASGVKQMGATVQLYDRYDNLVRKALSTDDGKFAFASLAPDVYTLRVTLSSFFPAVRRI